MSRIILVIDGERLIELCKSKLIGVQERYTIDEDYLSGLEVSEVELDPAKIKLIGSKLITQNDIRTRIIRIPKEMKQLIAGKLSIDIQWEDGTKDSHTLNEQGNFISGVTSIFRKFGLIDTMDNLHEMLSEWECIDGGFIIRFKKAEYQERHRLTSE